MLESLLVSADAKLTMAIQQMCAKVAIYPNLCPAPQQAAVLLARSKCSGIIIDGADPPVAAEILDLIRRSPSNKHAVSIALLTASTKSLGAMFELRMPLAPELALRTFRAARAAMFNEFRRYCRHPLGTPVILTTPSGMELHGRCINLSHNGLGIQLTASETQAKKTVVHARFVLPPAGRLTEVKGEIVWCNPDGRSGLQCQGASLRDRHGLDDWLTKRA